MSAEIIRVDMVILEYYPVLGGAQRQLAQLAPLLRSRGVEIRVLTRRYAGLEPYAVVDGVPVLRLAAPGHKVTAAPSFTAGVINAIRRRQPDLLHAYSLFSPLAAAVMAKRLFGIPVIDKVQRSGWPGDVARIQRKRFGSRRLKTYCKYTDVFITISDELDRELDQLGVPATKREFIPNGVDVDLFRPADSDQKRVLREKLQLPPGPLVVYSGRLVPEKRVDLLITAWQRLTTRYPQANLLILGSGPLENELRELAGPAVHFVGQVDDVAAYLRAADCFVLPSNSEGLSNSLLEALACGLPAVATRVGGAPDLIEHKKSGWLIDPDDAQQIEQGLDQLLSQPALGSELGQSARAFVCANFSLESVASKMVKLYRDVLQQQTRRNPKGTL